MLVQILLLFLLLLLLLPLLLQLLLQLWVRQRGQRGMLQQQHLRHLLLLVADLQRHPPTCSSSCSN